MDAPGHSNVLVAAGRRLVGRRAVAWAARALYGERADGASVEAAGTAGYRWRSRDGDGVLPLGPLGEPREAAAGASR